MPLELIFEQFLVTVISISQFYLSSQWNAVGLAHIFFLYLFLYLNTPSSPFVCFCFCTHFCFHLYLPTPALPPITLTTMVRWEEEEEEKKNSTSHLITCCLFTYFIHHVVHIVRIVDERLKLLLEYILKFDEYQQNVCNIIAYAGTVVDIIKQNIFIELPTWSDPRFFDMRSSFQIILFPCQQ